MKRIATYDNRYKQAVETRRMILIVLLALGCVLLLPLLAVCAVIVWALPCSQHVMLGRADGSRPRLHWQPTLPWAVALALPALASLLLMQGHAFLSFRF